MEVRHERLACRRSSELLFTVWLGDEPSDVFSEKSWALDTYQAGEGAASRIEAFVGHIKRG